MKLKSLEYFEKLSQTKSFSQVADAFSVKQPTVSYAIKQLEEELDVTLITRDPAHLNIQLTPAGQILAEHTRRALFELNKAKEDILGLKHDGFRFGVSSTIKTNYFYQITTPEI